MPKSKFKWVISQFDKNYHLLKLGEGVSIGIKEFSSPKKTEFSISLLDEKTYHTNFKNLEEAQEYAVQHLKEKLIKVLALFE